MKRPDLIVLVINFGQSEKHRLQVNTKEFILGRPDKGEKGLLERKIEETLGSRTLSCQQFSLIKMPIALPGVRSENRARGAIGLFQYLGSADELEATLRAMERICTEAMGGESGAQFSKWSGFEIYLAQRWLQ